MAYMQGYNISVFVSFFLSVIPAKKKELWPWRVHSSSSSWFFNMNAHWRALFVVHWIKWPFAKSARSSSTVILIRIHSQACNAILWIKKKSKHPLITGALAPVTDWMKSVLFNKQKNLPNYHKYLKTRFKTLEYTCNHECLPKMQNFYSSWFFTLKSKKKNKGKKTRADSHARQS